MNPQILKLKKIVPVQRIEVILYHTSKYVFVTDVDLVVFLLYLFWGVLPKRSNFFGIYGQKENQVSVIDDSTYRHWEIEMMEEWIGNVLIVVVKHGNNIE